jgi:para-aminobenzoate synthetase component 1
VVSISPETFLRVAGSQITTRPIKGTRPRRDDPVTDRAEAEALERSAKDRAEHVMIVDLERNDLGRICDVATVRVPQLIALERHPTVWHLASTVTGRLRTGTGLVEVLAATFPSGSVTGAPKRMAWERIAALEPVRRGVYCGAIGVVTPGGCDLSVAIRTAVLAEGIASYGTGGGIVADSTPAAEWAEAMDKARAFAIATGARRS